MEIDAFQLSRIYAQGWNAAKQQLADGNFGVNETHAAALNPYRSGQGAARWAKGFEEALRSRAGPANIQRGNSWRPQVHE
jgi:hypothetical protein